MFDYSKTKTSLTRKLHDLEISSFQLVFPGNESGHGEEDLVAIVFTNGDIDPNDLSADLRAVVDPEFWIEIENRPKNDTFLLAPPNFV